MPRSHLDPALRFGVFDVNLSARELRKHGVRVRLPGQPFAILAMLLQRPGEVVTREEMRERLWASDTFVDFEHSLNSAIKKLRRALGDSPENPRYVETLPRIGYRFIAPVNIDLADARNPHFQALDGRFPWGEESFRIHSTGLQPNPRWKAVVRIARKHLGSVGWRSRNILFLR